MSPAVSSGLPKVYLKENSRLTDADHGEAIFVMYNAAVKNGDLNGMGLFALTNPPAVTLAIPIRLRIYGSLRFVLNHYDKAKLVLTEELADAIATTDLECIKTLLKAPNFDYSLLGRIMFRDGPILDLFRSFPFEVLVIIDQHDLAALRMVDLRMLTEDQLEIFIDRSAQVGFEQATRLLMEFKWAAAAASAANKAPADPPQETGEQEE